MAKPKQCPKCLSRKTRREFEENGMILIKCHHCGKMSLVKK